MTEESQTIQAVKDAAEAARLAATVAAEAVKVASQVAAEASRVASVSAIEAAKVSESIKYIQQDIAEIKQKLGSSYVTIDAFIPVRNIAYGLMGVLGVATLAAVLKLIFIKQ